MTCTPLKYKPMTKRQNVLLVAFIVALCAFLLVCLNASAQAATNSVSLAWNPVTNFPGVSYQVGYGTNSGTNTGIYQFTNAAPTNSITITNLTLGATYYFAVQTVDQPYAPSAWSSEVTATISRLPTPAGVRVTTIVITP